MNWDERYGPWALVTGASAGIGAEFVRQIADRGINVVLVARRKDRMEALAQEVEDRHGVTTRIVALDLAEPDAPDRLAEAVSDLDIGLLVNNAGFGLGRTFDEQDPQRLASMVALNCEVPVRLTACFLPAMKERGRGGLIFLASTAAYQGTPYFNAYGPTKAFNLMLGETLWKELRPLGIDSLALSPGFTSTEFAEVADMSDAGFFRVATADAVVRTGLRALGRKPSVIHGWLNRALVFTNRIVPRKVALAFTAAALKDRPHNRP